MSAVAFAARARERLAWHLPAIAGALLALPTLLAFYPPMTDLAGHEAIVGILRHWGDETYFPPGLYALNLGHSNQLFHAVSWLLSFGVGTRWAVKITIALAQFSILHAAGRFAEHLGRARWTALFVAPLALGFAYYWGFVANLLGYAALLYALPLLDRATRTPSWRLAVASCGALVLLMLAHGSVFIMAIPALFFLGVLHPHGLRQRVVALTPFGFAAGLCALAWWRASRLFSSEVPTYPTYFVPFVERVRALPESLVGLEDPRAHAALAALTFAAALAIAAWRALARSPAAESTGWRLRVVHYRFEILALLCIAAYFVAPYHFQGSMFIHQRFLGPGWAVLVLSGTPDLRRAMAVSARAARARTVAKALALAVPIGVLLAGLSQFTDADRVHRDLEVTLEQIPMKSSVTFLAIDRGQKGPRRAFDLASSFARSVARRGGRAGPSFTSSPISAVLVAPEYRWSEHTLRIVGQGSHAMKPSHDLDRFGWIVARTRSPGMPSELIEAFAPDAELAFQRGEWMLFRSTHEVAALTSPDVPAPEAAPSIIARIIAVEAARRARARAAP